MMTTGLDREHGEVEGHWRMKFNLSRWATAHFIQPNVCRPPTPRDASESSEGTSAPQTAANPHTPDGVSMGLYFLQLPKESAAFGAYHPWQTAIEALGIARLSQCLLPSTDGQGAVDFSALMPNVVMLALTYAQVWGAGIGQLA